MPGLRNSSDPTPVAIVGAGAVGATLARGFAEHKHRIESVLGRTAVSAQDLADRVGAPTASDVVSDRHFLFTKEKGHLERVAASPDESNAEGS